MTETQAVQTPAVELSCPVPFSRQQVLTIRYDSVSAPTKPPRIVMHNNEMTV